MPKLPPSSPASGYPTARAVAALLGLEVATLRKMRWQGRGPKGFFHISKTAVRYDPEAPGGLYEWLEDRKNGKPEDEPEDAIEYRRRNPKWRPKRSRKVEK